MSNMHHDCDIGTSPSEYRGIADSRDGGAIYTVRWVLTAEQQVLNDVAVDFLEGKDESLEMLDAYRARVLVRTNEIVITYCSSKIDERPLAAFSRRHPDAEIDATFESAGTVRRFRYEGGREARRPDQ